MAKIFETDSSIVELVNDEFDKVGLTNLGLNLRVMSLTKAKDIIKVTKASPATEFLAKKDAMVQVFIYEEAFVRLDEESQKILIEMAISNVSYDLEKDRLNIDTNPFNQVFNSFKKYQARALQVLETSYLVIQQIEEEKAEKRKNKQEKQND